MVTLCIGSLALTDKKKSCRFLCSSSSQNQPEQDYLVSTEPHHVGPELSSSARPSLILTEAKDDSSWQDYGDVLMPRFEMLLEVPDMEY